MTDVIIREAGEEDLPSVLALCDELDLDGDGERLPLEDARRIYARMQSYPDYRLFVATIGEEIVGTFTLLIMDNLAHSAIPSGIIENVVVSPKTQGKGVGKQIMLYAIARCRELGCYKLALSTDIRRTDAHRFYESLGFGQQGYSFSMELRQ